MKRCVFILGLLALTLGVASCDITFGKKNEVPPADSNSIVMNTEKGLTLRLVHLSPSSQRIALIERF